jgi:hypothetical protein
MCTWVCTVTGELLKCAVGGSDMRDVMHYTRAGGSAWSHLELPDRRKFFDSIKMRGNVVPSEERKAIKTDHLTPS